MAAVAFSDCTALDSRNMPSGKMSGSMAPGEINDHNVGSLAAMSGQPAPLPPFLLAFSALPWTSVQQVSTFHVMTCNVQLLVSAFDAALTDFVLSTVTGTEKTLLWDRVIAEGTSDPNAFRAYDVSDNSSQKGFNRSSGRTSCTSWIKYQFASYRYWFHGCVTTVYKSPTVLLWPIFIFILFCGLGLGFVIGLAGLSETTNRETVRALGQSTVRGFDNSTVACFLARKNEVLMCPCGDTISGCQICVSACLETKCLFVCA
jgi:hypothetical protein